MSAPSFSSFPPSFSSFPDLDAGSSKRSRELSKTRGSDHEDEKKKKHDKSSRKGKDSARDARKKRKLSHTKDDAQRVPHSPRHQEEYAKQATEDAASRLFFSDRKGDRYNVEYGGLHAGDVPKYSLVGRGRHIFGLSYAWIATHRSGKGIEVGPNDRRKMSSLTDSSSRALLAAPPTRRIMQTGDTYKYQEVNGFLRLPSGRRQKQNDQSYRSITRPKDDAHSDSESSDASEHPSVDESSGDESEGVVLTAHQETLKLLEQGLQADPTSIDKWLQLLTQTLSTIPISSKNATKARSEITISILARALAADPRNAASKLLRLRFLQAGEEVWHESKVRAEWEDALKVGGVEIWLEWLEWRIRKANNGVDGIVADAVRVLNVMDQDELAKVRVFWRVGVVFKNAGFSERTTAMFQAQAELMFEVPQALYGLPHDTQLDHLEEFWESEVPRVGEEEARGWAAWVSAGRKPPSSRSIVISSTNDEVDLDPYRHWSAQERNADHTNVFPSRSSDDSDDPYSMILFSDIRPLLLNLQSPRAKDAFRLAWLSVLGLNIPGFSASLSTNELNWDDRWNQDYLTRPSYLDALFPAADSTQNRLTTEAVSGVIVGREREYVSGFGPVRSWGYGVLGPLDGLGSEKSGKRKGRAWLWGEVDVDGLDGGFVRRLFVQLRLGAEDEEWDILSLAFEAAINVKSAVKFSRLLLSKDESLPRWAAHAQVETMRGRLDDARKVYQTILMAASNPNSPGTSLLWWNWAEMEWIAGHSVQALQVVLRAVGVESQGGIAALRAKRGLDDAIKGEAQWKLREAWIKLRALLEVLSTSEPSAALRVFDDHLFGERKIGVRRESLIVACLLMLYHYGVTLKNPMPPSMLRQRVEKALEEYPSNSVILGLFLEGERGQGIWGRVRGILGENGGKMKDVVRRVEEVWIAGWERGRWRSEIERTRSGLAAAVESERTRGSHVTWRVYLEFEIRAGQLQRAKKLLFRAIGECPLVKELYLLAFGALRGVFSANELNGIADTMAERGLRLRRGLDEVLAGWNNVEENKEEMSDSGDDEIVDNARELRRLMPY
ncbi:Protein NRDE2 [Hypsizygus marmoreus]|uniref:Protein NRDE2 n=1 Tax=Hypsizygus marmoreus TaxID=39966 RepID=A0A369K6I7_HYPMA|nr:Protein NRDE2 [Hypsizygus marmoreus]